MSITTLADLFLVAAGYHKSECLLHKVGGEFHPISTAEVTDGVRRVARALESFGIGPGDRVALMAENGPHWPTVDFATLCRGAATVPIYPTLLPDQAAYIAHDSGAKVLFVQTRDQLEGFLRHRGEVPALEKIVLIHDATSGTDPDDVLSWDEVLELGADADPDAFEAQARKAKADDLASLVYTSGTTGKPKGVMLTHGNFVSNVVTAMSLVDFRDDQTALSFLPLAHVFERMIDFCYFYKGVSIAYAESVQTVAEDMRTVKPHVFVSVPRVYEKVYAKVQENVAAGSGVQQKIFRWAEEVGRKALPYHVRGDEPGGLLGLQLAVARGLVYRKLRERLGGRFEYAVSGGAPLGRELAEFFWSMDLHIFEGYGLTETSPVIAVNYPGNARLGTVGKPIPGIEVEIAADGEILTRGPHVMKGYYNQPEATAEVLDPDGWFHTGDIGELTDEGYLRITDRKKEIIVNAYGKNVAPAPIENRLKASRWISQAVIIGDQRKFLSALLVPDFDVLAAWASEHGKANRSVEELVADPELRELVQADVAAVNKDLAHYEQIVTWTLLSNDFTLEGGELTPTQKVKRRVIRDKYGNEIEQMYVNAKPPAKSPEEVSA